MPTPDLARLCQGPVAAIAVHLQHPAEAGKVRHRPLGVELLDLRELVGGPEAVEEVHEGDAGFERGLGCDQGHVHAFLDVLGAEHAPAGLAGGIDVTVVAEDRQALGGQRTGGDVEDGRRQFAGDLVHIGDHQQEPLGGSEGRAEGTGGQRAVQRTGDTGLGLHLGDDRNGVPDVLLLDGRFRIRFGSHRRGRRDGVDGDDFAGGIGDMGTGLVAVDGDHSSRHELFSSVGSGCAAGAAWLE